MADNSQNPFKIAIPGGGGSQVVEDDSAAPAIERVKRMVRSADVFVFMKGVTLDFQDGLKGRGFVFVNPNATNTCGCRRTPPRPPWPLSKRT